VERQLDAFTDAFGRMPDLSTDISTSINFRWCANQLIECLLALQAKSPPWLRICLPPPASKINKSRIIAMLGAHRLLQLARSAGFPTSACLVGVYGFDLRRDAYLARVRQWLQAGSDGAVFMCHPSTKTAATDPIGSARRNGAGRPGRRGICRRADLRRRNGRPRLDAIPGKSRGLNDFRAAQFPLTPRARTRA